MYGKSITAIRLPDCSSQDSGYEHDHPYQDSKKEESKDCSRVVNVFAVNSWPV